MLFPMIRELAAASDAAASSTVRDAAQPDLDDDAEHDRAGDLLAALRQATDGYAVPDDGCASYTALYARRSRSWRRDTHLHVHKENNVLFPAVVELEIAVEARP